MISFCWSHSAKKRRENDRERHRILWRYSRIQVPIEFAI